MWRAVAKFQRDLMIQPSIGRCILKRYRPFRPELSGSSRKAGHHPRRDCLDILNGWQSFSPALADAIGQRWVNIGHDDQF